MDGILKTYRDKLRAISVPWLQNGLAEKLLYAIGIQLDAAADGATAALKLRFPGLYSFDTLALIGKERRIVRGRFESDADYAERLRGWLDAHRYRGNPYSLLAQIYEYFRPGNFTVHLRYHSGAYYTMSGGDGSVERFDQYVTDNENYTRLALLYYTSGDIRPTDVDIVAAAPREWLAAHALGEVIVLPIEGTSWLWDWPPDRLWNDPDRLWNCAPEILRVPVTSEAVSNG